MTKKIDISVVLKEQAVLGSCVDLLTRFKNQIKEWNRAYKDLEFIYNKDLDIFIKNPELLRSIESIWLGDNPGFNEREQNSYLVHVPGKGMTAGNIAKQIFDYLEIDSRQYLILNKSPIFTKKTGDLKKLITSTKDQIFNESQIYMANLALNLHTLIEELNKNIGKSCNIYIFGIGNSYNAKTNSWMLKRKASLFASFYSTIKEKFLSPTQIEQLIILPHFCYWSILKDLVIDYEKKQIYYSKGKAEFCKRITLKELTDNQIDKSELLNAFKELPYTEALLLKKNNNKLRSRGFEEVSKSHRIQTSIFYYPSRSTKFSAGYDFKLPISFIIRPKELKIIATNIKTFMLEDEVLEIHIRSSVGIKKNVILANATGIIDSDYYSNEENDGNIMLCLYNMGDNSQAFSAGEKIVQGIFKKFLFSDDDDDTRIERKGGIGSTSKKNK